VDDYVELRGLIAEIDEDGLAERLSGWPVLGILVEPREADRASVAVWIRAGDPYLEERVAGIVTGFATGGVDRSAHRDADWAAAWRASLAPFEVGERWWIDPHPDRATDAPPGRLRLAIEARAAFGSGTHESTQLALLQLERLGCEGLRVLDVGTGSGVLAVAADRLGAAMVVAVDTDRVAAWEARSTARRQTWSCRPLIVAGPVGCLVGVAFDLVLCNMIHSELGPLLGEIRRLTAAAGRVVLSGMLACEREAVETMLGEEDLEVRAEASIGEWIGLTAAPAGAS
jgi:ribosomal protein L11 methyltransferase